MKSKSFYQIITISAVMLFMTPWSAVYGSGRSYTTKSYGAVNEPVDKTFTGTNAENLSERLSEDPKEITGTYSVQGDNLVNIEETMKSGANSLNAYPITISGTVTQDGNTTAVSKTFNGSELNTAEKDLSEAPTTVTVSNPKTFNGTNAANLSTKLKSNPITFQGTVSQPGVSKTISITNS